MSEQPKHKQSIHVVLDSSILRQDPRRKSASFDALEELCDKGLAKMHLPEVVCKEMQTYLAAEQQQALHEITNALGRFGRRDIPVQGKEGIDAASVVLEKYKEAILNQPQASFDEWCKGIGAKIRKVNSDHGEKVMKAYFNGEPPFKKVKSRGDFPDAFIHESIRDLAQEVGKVHAVIGDKNLGRACQGISGVKVYETLEDFITSPECHALLRDQAFEKEIPVVLEILAERKDKLEGAIEFDIVDALAGKTIEDDNIPSDDHTAYIHSVGSLTQLEFEFDEAVYIGAGIVNISFNCVVEVQASYYIYKSDLYMLPESRIRRISASEYDNRHYYDAEETLEVRVQGVISIEFDLAEFQESPLAHEMLEDALEEATLKIDSINDITIEPRANAEEEWDEDQGPEEDEELREDVERTDEE
jgi:hypothetical protein